MNSPCSKSPGGDEGEEEEEEGGMIMNLWMNLQAHVFRRLQGLHDDPELLDRARDRFNKPPPPVAPTPTSSEKTLCHSVNSDADASRNLAQAWYLRRAARNASRPITQFMNQARREMYRLSEQEQGIKRGRRPTLPYDDTADSAVNAENNVRRRWVAQGIWAREWGPAWPKGRTKPPAISGRAYGDDGPFRGLYAVRPHQPWQGETWGHEDPSPGPEPASEPPLSWSSQRRKARPEEQTIPQPLKYLRKPGGVYPQYRIPKTLVRSPEASRPYRQFQYQVSQERKWIKDELDYKPPIEPVDIDALAYKAIRANWVQDGIWNPNWGELPGMTWHHEEPDEEPDVEIELPARFQRHEWELYNPDQDSNLATPTSEPVYACSDAEGPLDGNADDTKAPLPRSLRILSSHNPGALGSSTDDISSAAPTRKRTRSEAAAEGTSSDKRAKTNNATDVTSWKANGVSHNSRTLAGGDSNKPTTLPVNTETALAADGRAGGKGVGAVRRRSARIAGRREGLRTTVAI